jgi:DNA invertase Pin-like site-specific DNA recombinase
MTTTNAHTPAAVAALYARVSTSKQDTSVDIQVRRALEYAAENGLHVPDQLRFVDSDVSGGKPLRERPQGRLMLNMMPLWNVRHVIFTKLDRLGRNLMDIETTIQWFEKQGIEVHITDARLPQDRVMGKVMRQIMGVFAEFEREMIRSRIQQNVDQKREQGLQTGHVPFGHRAVPVPSVENKQGKPMLRIVLDPEEQATLARMRAWRGQGWSYHRIARALNGEGISTKTGKGRWQSGNVKNVLTSRYAMDTLEANLGAPASRRPEENHAAQIAAQ